MEHLWKLISPVKGQIRWALVLSLLSIIATLFGLLVIAEILRQLKAMESAWGLAFLVLGLIIVAFACRGLSLKVSHQATFRLERILRLRLAERLAQTSLGYLSDQGSSALIKVMQDDVHKLHLYVADATPYQARAYGMPVVSFILLLWIDWRMALVALAFLLFGIAVLSIAMRSNPELPKMYAEARERVTASVLEFVQAMPVVRTFDTGESSFGRYQRALDHYLKVLVKWYEKNGFAARSSLVLLSPMPIFLLLLWIGLYWWHGNSLDFSSWLAILLLGTTMTESIMPFMLLFHMIENSKASAMRLVEVLDAPILALKEPLGEPQEASLVFEDVSFKYSGREENAVQNLSFTAAAGTMTALVGASGAGKSTAARLIPRFWDVDEGRILIGGIDIRSMRPELLMQKVAFVFQDNFLFSGSIADNIRLASPSASMEEVMTAAKAAQAHDFIMALPKGYESEAGERGGLLSGGQRQRIAIARAILQNRPILVLDEATAFADPENERALMLALKHLMQNKTVLIIAHRLSTIQRADQILVFEQGRIVEQGRHEELLTLGGRYAKLWSATESARQWRLKGRVPLHRECALDSNV